MTKNTASKMLVPQDKQTKKPWNKPRKKLSGLQAFFLLLLCAGICAGSAVLFLILVRQNIYQDFSSLQAEKFDEISDRYSIYAISDYQDDYNMDILSQTNFRYGVIHSDEFDTLDLSDLSNYEVQNFDEEFDLGNVDIYSCYRDEETSIHCDMSLFGSASLVNSQYLTEDHTAPISQFVYNYNNNCVYAVADQYLFPLSDAGLCILKLDESELSELEGTSYTIYLPDETDAESDSADTNSETAVEYELELTTETSSAETDSSETSYTYLDTGNETYVSTYETASESNNSDYGSEEQAEKLSSEDSISVQYTGSSDQEETEELADVNADTGRAYLISDEYDRIAIDSEDVETVQISSFQSEISLSSAHDYVWNDPYSSYLYSTELGCIVPLCDVEIADFRTFSDYGTSLTDDNMWGYRFDSDISITYSLPIEVERTGDSYYVVSYVPSELDTSKTDLYTQTAQLLAIVYRLRYLPIVTGILSGLLAAILLFLLAGRAARFLTLFYRENVPLVVKCFLLVLLVTLFECLLLVFISYMGSFVISNRYLLLLLLEKLCIAPFFIRYAMQVDKLKRESSQLASGDFSHTFDTGHMSAGLQKIGDNLNQMRDGMQAAVDDRIKSEHFKSELITNVSHDIKTPLTSIVNYVDLLKKEEPGSPSSQEYLDVLERQSVKLKKLLEDLIEAAKASAGNLKVSLERCDVSVLLSQVTGEYEERLSEKQVTLCTTTPETPVFIQADTRHLQRVFDNLMVNVYKYALPGTRAYVNLEIAGETACVVIRNISSTPLNISADELLERFVQGDASRSTEGHGLGLTIAQTLMELMGGQLRLTIDGDLFKVTLEWEIVSEGEEADSRTSEGQ